MIIYLTLDDVLAINSKIRKQSEVALRDQGLLESALARPMASAFGSDAYPSIFEKAAALLDSLSRNHPFVDGNKRTATAALILFLDENGYRVTWKPEEALEFILAVAQGQRDIVTIAAWLKENSSPLETDS